MEIPGFQDFMLPILQFVVDEKEHTFKEVAGELAYTFGLSDDDLKQMLPSGRQTTFANRYSWARIYLKEAGLIQLTPARTMNITSEGRQVLSKKPSRIDMKYLSQFPKFVEFRQRGKNTGRTQEAEGNSEQTPEEIIDQNYRTLRNVLVNDLLARVKASSSEFFEILVLKLLVAMGYGIPDDDAARVTGKPGDEGIDGTINEDKLGLDVIYVQAKKWENGVGRPTVQAFVGSLEGKRARKGVFITSSYFTGDAKKYVGSIEKRIVLIDGEQLAQLMIDYGIGVAAKDTYIIKKIDEDYFNQE